jgi:sirohydrochlorin cobaltochelatase
MNNYLRIILILAATSISFSSVGAQSAERVGTVIIAHGGDSLWNAGVMQVAREAVTGGPVEVSLLMGPGAATTRFQDAVAKLERAGATRIVVVPLLVSSHSGHYEQIRYLVGQTDSLDHVMEHHLHMSGIERPTTRIPLQLTPALDASDEMATVLADRAMALVRAQGDVPSARALLIVGHGPNDADDYAAWMANLRPVAARVQAATGFRDVRVELVRDDAPAAVRAEAVLRTRELIEMQTAMTGKHVIVVPVLISKGAVSRDKLPADIAGTTSVYNAEPLLPHSAMARWIESRVRASGSPARGR